MNTIKFPYLGKGEKALETSLKHYKPPFLQLLYKEMLRIRLIEEAVADRYQEDEMKTPIHLAIGQEAVAVGSCHTLRRNDTVFCGHRTHAIYLAKGGDFKAMLSEFHCRLNGCCGSRGGSMHLLDKKVGMAGSSAIVAGIVPIATGSALAAKQKGEDRITIAYLGDAAVEEGACWESFNFAKLKELPIIYICENNYFSVCSPIDYRQPKNTPLYKKAAAFGLNSTSIDGNNVLEVYDTTSKAIRDIRQGKGPAFIEAHTYRWRGHHGDKEDYMEGHRSKEELDHWKTADPIALLQEVLIEASFLNKKTISEMKQEIHEEIEEAFAHALSSPLPTKEDLLTHVYSP